MEIKYFVIYGTWKAELKNASGVKKAMAEFVKKVEEAGLKIQFWGSPYGTNENAICVMKGTVEAYTKITMMETPYTNAKTHMVLIW